MDVFVFSISAFNARCSLSAFFVYLFQRTIRAVIATESPKVIVAINACAAIFDMPSDTASRVFAIVSISLPFVSSTWVK